MNPSDFLSTLGILLAVFALYGAKGRRFLLTFFSPFSVIAYIILVLWVHFLMAFDWLIANWWPFLEVLTVKNGIPANTWAYIATIGLIIYPIYKVNLGFFTKKRTELLIDSYLGLISDGDFNLLFAYLEKYHVEDIKSYLTKMSTIERDDSILPHWIVEDKAYNKQVNNLLANARLRIAKSVYWSIVTNEQFIEKCTEQKPEIIGEILEGITTKEQLNKRLVSQYASLLITRNSGHLIRELQLLNDFMNSILERENIEKLRIVRGLLINTEAAHNHNVWYHFGEEAIKSLKYNSDLKTFLKKEHDDKIKNEYWSFNLYTSLVFFNYMVRECIYRDSGYHMWLYYYSYFVRDLIKSLHGGMYDHRKEEYASFGHYLIYEIFDTMDQWLTLSKELDHDFRVIDTIKCIGDSVDYLIKSPSDIVGDVLKKGTLRRLISTWFRNGEHPNDTSELTTQWLTMVLVNPKAPEHQNEALPTNYATIVEQAWNDFDDYPYRNDKSHWGLIEEFQETVLNPLNNEN